MKLQTYQTNALTWRMLVDGNVHPRLVGFETELECIRRTQNLIDNGDLRRPDFGPFDVITSESHSHEINFDSDVLIISTTEHRGNRANVSTSYTYITAKQLDALLATIGYKKEVNVVS